MLPISLLYLDISMCMGCADMVPQDMIVIPHYSAMIHAADNLEWMLIRFVCAIDALYNPEDTEASAKLSKLKFPQSLFEVIYFYYVLNIGPSGGPFCFEVDSILIFVLQDVV